ncbi:MAG: PadR family transcriptional regulator [Gemmatimonadetes bacterium]|uniref:PadR family transcriptional regulator n=1 Tax=Candidatus Kutchimonas denitrificans TaxID=3056748 RepID=A0AAE4Z8E6_9BACT|nr:PadR family transcriptional regulator [Gemmatimonadota bacterium]NIR75725.1 PadR family transcriptional regulator [Candidatus Kutchimonas denitrificans]NIS00338.1 PadR family transcriptional regulator [Gemmatimonadota bacterium]NIT65997.1 PadR family transcriptional regulator [Gemmatimonadota bacterium]NIU53701.1 PadR family transcriptional regulator [Gemmatimonadota bacterium]
MASALDLLPGTLDLMVLRALTLGEQHGYGVAETIHERTDGAFVLEEAALYKALHRLEHEGLLEAEWGVSENNRRAKYYRLTSAGRARLRKRVSEWRRYVAAVSKLLEPAPAS